MRTSLAILALAVSCSSNTPGTATDSSTSSLDSSTSPNDAETCSPYAVEVLDSGTISRTTVATILSNCAVCHSAAPGDASATGGLVLDSNWYATLVNQPSIQAPSMKQIVPGDPEHSYFIRKIVGASLCGVAAECGANCGTEMYIPSTTQLQQLVTWVSQGCP